MFEGAVDVMILINCILIVVETEYEMSSRSSGIPILEAVEPVFTLIYVVELLLKLLVLGWTEYWHKLRNRFDLFVVGALVMVEVDMLFSVNEGNKWAWIRYMLVVRLLRCLRLLVAVRRFNMIFATFLQLVPAFITLFGMLFALMTLYAQIGLQAFGGKIYVGNPDLKNTNFAEHDYYVNNFNDYATAMVTLFELLVVNKWYVIMDGVVAATSKVFRLYFISFYAVAVVMVLNLVVAFILEAFFEKEMEHDLSRDEVSKSPMMGDDVDQSDMSSNPHFVTLEETL
jgi:two pore calcium channel protein